VRRPAAVATAVAEAARVGGRGRRWIVLTILLGAGCGTGGQEGRAPEGIELSDAYAAEPVTTDVAAVYLTIRNHGATPDTLTGAQTPIAGMVHVHRMAGIGGAQMRATEAVEVPARGQVQLRPGSLHLMLMSLTRRPQVGDTIEITLQFARAGAISVRAPVVSYLDVSERATVGAQETPQ
jgi:copper(I)-binding protein